MLEEAVRNIEGARFGRESDRPIAIEMMRDYEWLVRNAIEQAQRDPLRAAIDPRSGVDGRASRAQHMIEVPSPTRRRGHTPSAVPNLGHLEMTRVASPRPLSPRARVGEEVIDI